MAASTKRAPTNTDAELWSKMGFGLKQYILHRCWLGKSSLLLPERSSERTGFPHGVCGRKNLFSCWQISYHAGSVFVEDIPITKKLSTNTDARWFYINLHARSLYINLKRNFSAREENIKLKFSSKFFSIFCPSCEGTHVLAPHTDRLFPLPKATTTAGLVAENTRGILWLKMTLWNFHWQLDSRVCDKVQDSRFILSALS